jgi:DNA-directed RNA polymerase subunit RPC12/RpoP
MLETDTAGSESTLYVCRACGTGVRSPDQQSECPDCGGSLREHD